MYVLILYGTYTQGTMTALQATFNCVLLFGSYIAIPLIYMLKTKTKEKERIKKISIISSIVVSIFWISTYYWNLVEYNSTVLLAYVVSYLVIGIVFYFVNFNLFYMDKKTEKNSSKDKQNSSSNDDDFDEKKYKNLKNLKKLLDDNIITQEEFEKEKKKILK